MSETIRPPGKTTIAPEVLITIAKLTALNVPGVSRLSTNPVNVNKIFRKGANEGVVIEVEDDVVYADIFVIIERDQNIQKVCRMVQEKVARAISEMVGMEVGKINVHVEDIDYIPETLS